MCGNVYCTESKWKSGYGQQYRGDQCSVVESFCARQNMAHVCTLEHFLHDARQRQFAVVVANGKYLHWSPLPGAIKDAQIITQKPETFGILVRKLTDQTRKFRA